MMCWTLEIEVIIAGFCWKHKVVQVFVEGKTRKAPNLQQNLLDNSSKAAEQQLAKLMGSTSPSCLPLRVPHSKLAKVGLQLASCWTAAHHHLHTAASPRTTGACTFRPAAYPRTACTHLQGKDSMGLDSSWKGQHLLGNILPRNL
jgi:hypothetical protein